MQAGATMPHERLILLLPIRKCYCGSILCALFLLGVLALIELLYISIPHLKFSILLPVCERDSRYASGGPTILRFFVLCDFRLHLL